jgi:hypothetical protein
MPANLIPDASPAEIHQEIQTFEQHYSSIRRKVGKYVLIQGSIVVDYFDTYKEAIDAGYEMFGLQNFFVRQVRENESPINVMRCGVKKMTGPLKLVRSKKQ